MPDESPSVNPRAHFLTNLHERIRMFNFLDASYKGGIEYKNSRDAFGDPILIEHENEWPGDANRQSLFHAAKSAGTADGDSLKHNRYFRRKRIASFENHVKPIVDKIASYAIRNAPKRKDGTQEDVDRIQLDAYIEDMVCEGLKISEAWIGWDTVAIPIDTELNKLQAKEFDPEHEGKPYLVMMDARRIVDFELDPDDEERVIRVVYEVITHIKGSLTKKATKEVRYKEWDADSWRLYKKADQGQSDKVSEGVEVVLESEGKHAFGRCPWIRYEPPFPIEDIAEMNRALFNMSSLLDEELYNCTFTQKWITGEKPDNIKGAEGGTGNTLVIPSPEANIGTFGAISGQAASLMDRINHLREGIYMLVSMENSSTKNVAETAEKKKRDLESLYTMLTQLVKGIEKIENELLIGMEIINEDDEDGKSEYDRKFDVNSIEELQEEISRLSDMPIAPPSLKRHLAMQLIQKLDPFGDHQRYQEELDSLMISDEAFVRGVEMLKSNGLYTPDLLADLLGVPDNSRKEFIAMVSGHGDEQEDGNDDDLEGGSYESSDVTSGGFGGNEGSPTMRGGSDPADEGSAGQEGT